MSDRPKIDPDDVTDPRGACLDREEVAYRLQVVERVIAMAADAVAFCDDESQDYAARVGHAAALARTIEVTLTHQMAGPLLRALAKTTPTPEEV